MAINRFSLLVAFLLCASLAQAQTFDAGTSAFTTAATSLTWSHTTANQPDRFLKVSCGINDSSNSANTVPSISYAGSSTGTAIVDSDGTADLGSDNSHLIVWGMVAPATDANNVVANYTVDDGYRVCGAETFYGVNQTTPTGTSVSRTGGVTAETSSSLTPTSVASQLVTDSIVWRYDGQGTITIGASQTERFTGNGADSGCCGIKGSTETAAGGTTTMSWTWATAGWTPSTHVAFRLIPSAIPGGGAQYHYNQQTNGR